MKIDDTIQYLCARVGGHWLGIETAKILEIVNSDQKNLYRFNGSAERDSVNYQGQSIPAINMSRFITGDDDHIVTTGRILVSELNKQRYGLIVDSAEEIIRISPEMAETLMPCSPDINSEAVVETFEIDDRKIHIISLDKVLGLAGVEK
jgi:chemotaxis signal transduction protein